MGEKGNAVQIIFTMYLDSLTTKYTNTIHKCWSLDFLVWRVIHIFV